MTDTELLEKLASLCGGHVPLAKRLGITRQTLWDWKNRGIFKHGRLAVAAVAQEYGVAVPKSFSSPKKNGSARA